MITNETKDKILSVASIVDVVSGYVKLTKKGANHSGCCPFHNERTASFVVSQTKGVFKCFGCGESGSVIDFVMKHDHLSYPEAMKVLGAKYGIDVNEKETAEEKAKHSKREAMKAALKWSAKYFNANTFIPEAAQYLEERKLSKEIIEEFYLGYSLPQWNAMEKCATDNGISKEALTNSGLIKKSDKGSTFDYFRDRIMFPFMDLGGNIIGYTARIIVKDEKQAKYLNSPDTDLYKKGEVIYGLCQAKKHIVSCDSAYFVEGNIDVLSFHQKGIRNTVCGSGTAFTKQQAQLLKRFTNNITIVYDGDPAGIKATFKPLAERRCHIATSRGDYCKRYFGNDCLDSG